MFWSLVYQMSAGPANALTLECVILYSASAFPVIINVSNTQLLARTTDVVGTTGEASVSGLSINDGLPHVIGLRDRSLYLDGVIIDTLTGSWTGGASSVMRIGDVSINATFNATASVSHVAMFATDPGAAFYTRTHSAMSGYLTDTSSGRIARHLTDSGPGSALVPSRLPPPSNQPLGFWRALTTLPLARSTKALLASAPRVGPPASFKKSLTDAPSA